MQENEPLIAAVFLTFGWLQHRKSRKSRERYHWRKGDWRISPVPGGWVVDWRGQRAALATPFSCPQEAIHYVEQRSS